VGGGSSGERVYVHAKMISVETVSGLGVREIKENIGEGKFKYDIFDTW
jgi:hypothetical protein